MRQILFILISLLLLVCQASVQAKESDPRRSSGRDSQPPTEETEETDITGYGDILFGSAIRDLDVTRMEPLARSDFARFWIVNDESYQTFTIVDKTLDATTIVGSLDNSTVAVVAIALEFPLTMDLDEISLYVRAVRSMYMDKYPQLPVSDAWAWDYDSYHTDWWIGDLEINDQDGDNIWAHWDGYSLMISYRNAEYQQAVWDNAVEHMTDQADKI